MERSRRGLRDLRQREFVEWDADGDEHERRVAASFGFNLLCKAGWRGVTAQQPFRVDEATVRAASARDDGA